jgi:bifunctional non-homologous end joining protein LigD
VSQRQKAAGTLPEFVTPMAARPVAQLPEGPEWLYELKLDGYRALLLKNGTAVEIRSRNDKDLTRMYPQVAEAALRLEAESAVIDGEIVALDAQARPSFQALQHRSSHPQSQILFYAFDLLHLNGRTFLTDRLEKRRAKLSSIVGATGPLRRLEELTGSASRVVQAVRALGLEGVIAKRWDSCYQPGERSGDWVKLRLDLQQEFVVGGYRPAGSDSLDALLLGFYAGKELRFAGKMRAGLVPHLRRELVRKLKPLHTAQCPFVNLPDTKQSRWGGGITAEQMQEMRWAKPKIVVQVRFLEWTAEGRLRHATYLGERADKEARGVRRES